MSLPSAVGQFLAFALEGLSTNFWGYRCPVYCVQPDWALLALTFLVGFASGIGCTLWFLGISFGSAGSPNRLTGPLKFLTLREALLASPCMGDEEPEVTRLVLGLEGLSLTVTTRKPSTSSVSPKFPSPVSGALGVGPGACACLSGPLYQGFRSGSLPRAQRAWTRLCTFP